MLNDEIIDDRWKDVTLDPVILYSISQRVVEAQGVYLRRNGWVHTSDNPGNIWLWRKEIDGVVYCVGASTAITITNAGG